MKNAVRVPVIDGLRGAAILLVVFYHIFEKTGWTLWPFTALARAGFMGVELFFFISGFCLMIPYARAVATGAPWPTLREYVSRRFWKIVPSYYLALLVVATAFPFDAQAGLSRGYDVFLHAFFLHGLNQASFISLNGNFWTLAIEVEFYVAFPLLVWLFCRVPVSTVAACTLVSLSYAAAIRNNGGEGWFYWVNQLPDAFALFAFGMLTAYLYFRYPVRPNWRFAFPTICLGACVWLLYDNLAHTAGGPASWSWENENRFVLAIVLAAFTLSALYAPAAVQRIIANPVLSFYADISYNVYLWNAAVVAFLLRFTWTSAVPYAVAVVTICTVVGVVLTYGFERPLMRFGRKIFVRTSSTNAALRKAA